MHHGHAEFTVSSKSGNQELMCVMSSNEYREQKGVDLSDYNKYLNEIWHHTINMMECANYT